jgi:HPt (histidine-containing phosphotransfer) domain-containing protein
VFDADDLVIRLGGDSELIRELVGLFLESYPERLKELGDAVEKQDAKRIEFLAHSLKSSVGNFSAWAAVHAAEKLENMAAKSEDLSGAAAAYARLDAAIGRLLPVLESLRKR